MSGFWNGRLSVAEERRRRRAPVEPSSKAARRRRMEIHQFRFLGADMAAVESDRKRKKLEIFFPGKEECTGGIEDRVVRSKEKVVEKDENRCGTSSSSSGAKIGAEVVKECHNFGMTSICGRRRDMEDAVAIHPVVLPSERPGYG